MSHGNRQSDQASTRSKQGENKQGGTEAGKDSDKGGTNR